jgi:hypothetical protein
VKHQEPQSDVRLAANTSQHCNASRVGSYTPTMQAVRKAITAAMPSVKAAVKAVRAALREAVQ